MITKSDNPLWVIYGLRAVDDSEYRYVGLTTIGASKRLSRHLWNTTTGNVRSKVYSWIKSVGTSEVVVDVLEECPEGDVEYLRDAEMFWITQIRTFGHRLTNLTEGGGGSTGATWTNSEETRRNQGLAKVGGLNPQFGKKAWNNGMKMSDGWVETRSEAQKKLWEDPTYADKMREKNRASLLHTNHKRWHVNRQIVNPDCSHCTTA